MQPPHMPTPPPPKKNAFKKGLGFVPSSIGRFENDPIKELLNTPPQATTRIELPVGDHATTETSGSTLPIFDLDHVTKTSGQERSRLIQAFGIGLTRVGFVGIKAENLTPLIDAVHKEMRRYFTLPFENKILDWQPNTPCAGFVPQQNEETSPDIKESFYVPPNFKGWPRGLTAFMRVMNQYHSTLAEYSRYLTQCIMTYVGQQDEKWSGATENLLQLVYHPMPRYDDRPQAFWTGPHSDVNLITLSTPGTVPGLQFLSPHGQWQPVNVPQGCLILNAGTLLEHKTAGLIKARRHRVNNPGGPYVRMERFSTVYSASWRADISLMPFDNCIALMTKKMSEEERQAHKEDYGEITVAEKYKTNSPVSLS